MPALSVYTIMIINKSGGLVYSRVCRCGRTAVAAAANAAWRRRRAPSSQGASAHTPPPPPSPNLTRNQDFEPAASRLDLNEALRVASVWHSVSEIARQLSPVHPSEGCAAGGGALVAMASDAFDLHCLPAPTGVRFVCVCAPGAPHVPHLLAR